MSTVLGAKMTAILRGLEICYAHSFFPLWVEVDLASVLAIIKADKVACELLHILSKIQRFIREHQIKFTHIYREGNAAADAVGTLGEIHKAYSDFDCQQLDRHIRGICVLDKSSCPYIRLSSKFVVT